MRYNKMIYLSIGVLAYNEEEGIYDTVREIYDILTALKIKFEIIIVDDGSTDNTFKIIQKIQRRYKNKIKVVRHKFNKGFGYAYRSAIKAAQGKYFSYVPGDGQFNFRDIKKYLQEIKNHQIILGYIENPEVRTIIRRAGSYLYILFIRLLFNVKVKYTNGFNLLRVAYLKKIKIISPGHTATAESVIKILKKFQPEYKCIGFKLRKEKKEKTSAFKLKSILNAIIWIWKIWFSIYIKKEL